MSNNIGVIGLGAMGSNIAICISQKYTCRIYDINPDNINKTYLENINIIKSSSLEELVTNSSIIVSSLPRSSDLLQIVDNLIKNNLFLNGQIWIDTTSGITSITQSIGKQLQTVNVELVDAS